MKQEYELKGTKDEVNSAIALFVNSGYEVHWGKRKVGNTTRKVLVVDDRKGDKEQ